MKPEPTSLGAALREVAADLAGGQSRVPQDALTGLAQHWEAIAGPRLCMCCLPGSFADGVLTVHAQDPGAASLVRQSAGEIALRMNDLLRTSVTRIRVVVTRPR